MNDVHAKIRSLFQSAGRILITSHVRPDGDAVGSTLALGLALMDSGKHVQMVLPEGLPDSFQHLPGSDLVAAKSTGNFDMVITLDCSDITRTGDILGGRKPDLVIDHHITSNGFGTINFVVPEAAATASILARYLPNWGLSITIPVAENLLTGILTDTIGFRTSNTTPEVLRQAADLLEMGANLSELYTIALERRSFPALKYWGAGLSSLEHRDGMVWATLAIKDRQDSKYPEKDDADLINLLSAMDNADIAMVFVELDENLIKISWRSLNPNVDVSTLAVKFGGGGHRAASGAEIEGNLADVRHRVLESTRQELLAN